VRLACARHLRDLETMSRRGLTWSPAHAVYAIEAFPVLFRHWKGAKWAGRPFTLAPWQAFIIGSIFGWYRPDGTRRIRIAYIELTRKQGKSMLAAGILLLATFFDEEWGAEGYCVATARKQARIVFDNCRQFVLRSPALRRRLFAGQHAIAHEATGSKLEPISKETPQQHGFNASVAVIDELHAHRTSELLDIVQSSMGARRQPLTVEITTAGVGRESICWQHRTYTTKLLEGLLPEDDAWFGFICAADPTDDWTAPATWKKANPNLGISVERSFLRDECRVARELVSKQNTFKQMYLGLWVEQAERWLDMAAWDQCAATPQAFGGRVVYAGLDLAATRDLTTIVYIADDDAGVVDVVCRFWIPERALEQRERTVQVAFRQWIAEGLLTVTPGDVLDYAAVRAAILEDVAAYGVSEIGYDPWNAQQLAGEFEAAGITMVPVRPGFSAMHDPTAALGERVVARTLRHGGHGVLRWMASNMVVARDADGRIKPDRKRAADKIDGIVALIMALDRLNRATSPQSAYADHDLLVISTTPEDQLPSLE
jgi:phage terminase large subunit-like protein